MRRLTPSVVERLGLPRTLRNVLLALVVEAKGREWCAISHDDLASKLLVSRKTVTRAMTALREMSLIETSRTRRRRDNLRGPDRIVLIAQPDPDTSSVGDILSLREEGGCGSECPAGLRDKMSQQLRYTSFDGDRDHESGRRAGDAGASGAPRFEPVNDGAMLKLIPGGRAA